MAAGDGIPVFKTGCKPPQYHNNQLTYYLYFRKNTSYHIMTPFDCGKQYYRCVRRSMAVNNVIAPRRITLHHPHVTSIPPALPTRALLGRAHLSGGSRANANSRDRKFVVKHAEARFRALQTSECNELLDPARASCMILAQRQPGKNAPMGHIKRTNMSNIRNNVPHDNDTQKPLRMRISQTKRYEPHENTPLVYRRASPLLLIL